jgi:hypothetical protein
MGMIVLTLPAYKTNAIRKKPFHQRIALLYKYRKSNVPFTKEKSYNATRKDYFPMCYPSARPYAESQQE